MRDIILDYIDSFIGAFFILVGIIAIPEIRRSKKYLVAASVLIVIMVILGFDKINRDKRDKTASDNKIDEVNNKLAEIRKSKTVDSIQRINEIANDREFQKRLLDEFKITRDSLNNKPVIKNTTTNIGKARDVYIQ